MRFCLWMGLAWLSISAWANPIEWQTYKQQDDITVSYKKHETGIIEIKASVLVKNAKASDFMALLSDTDNAANWLENVKSVTLMERLSPSETLVYTHFNSPWPVSDRDLVRVAGEMVRGYASSSVSRTRPTSVATGWWRCSTSSRGRARRARSRRPGRSRT